ncbi:DNA helicase B-like [Aquarana catesbeiana]|uniref:DNA helicase B-like n=1 Tax=Aquarana catesbeiana TaxID=8400 RepID=UPI003CCA5C7C
MSGRRVKNQCGGKGLIEGRLLPEKGEGEEIDWHEDVDLDDQAADPEFLDAEEIEEGAVQIPAFSPQKTTVRILAKDSEEYTVTGFFPLTDPWWSVSVNVKQGGSRYFVNGSPSYKLEDDILGDKAILSLFLKKCNVHEDHSSNFISWVEQHPPVTFRRLIKLAETFKKKEKIDIVPYLKNSGT